MVTGQVTARKDQIYLKGNFMVLGNLITKLTKIDMIKKREPVKRIRKNKKGTGIR